MARKRPAPSSVEALHKAVLACLDPMYRLSSLSIGPNDPEPEALVDLRRVAQALPEMPAADEDPFIGTSITELSPGGITWHRMVWERAQDWAVRLSAIVAESKRRKLGQTTGMPRLHPPIGQLKGFLLTEMNRFRQGQITSHTLSITPASKTGRRPSNSELLDFDELQRTKNPTLTDKEILSQFRKKYPHHPIFESDDPKGALRAARSRRRKQRPI